MKGKRWEKRSLNIQLKRNYFYYTFKSPQTYWNLFNHAPYKKGQEKDFQLQNVQNTQFQSRKRIFGVETRSLSFIESYKLYYFREPLKVGRIGHVDLYVTLNTEIYLNTICIQINTCKKSVSTSKDNIKFIFVHNYKSLPPKPLPYLYSLTTSSRPPETLLEDSFSLRQLRFFWTRNQVVRSPVEVPTLTYSLVR